MSEPEETTLVVEKLADDLRQEIDSGEYGNSGTLPSTTELSKRWSTSRSIVTQVMLLLRSQGHLRMVGNRYVVNRPRLVLPGLTKNFEQYLRDLGYDPVVDNLVIPSLETMPAEIAALFNQPAGIHVVHRTRRQGISGQALRIAENWYPSHLAQDFLDEMRENNQMDVLEAISNKYGIFVVRTEEEIAARIPSREEMKLLNIARYQPVIELIRSNFAVDGQPVMFNRILMVSTNFVLNREYPVNHWN